MGFFFVDNKNQKSSKKLSQAIDLAYSLECKVCSLKRQICKAPKMEPLGSDEPLIYIIGEFPNSEADKQNFPFSEEELQVIESSFNGAYKTKEIEDLFRWNNIVRCHPSKDRNPTELEIECCRKSIEDDIRKTKPLVIICFGKIALKWFINSDDIEAWRGRYTPVKIKDHTCWLFPMLHPAYIIKKKRDFKNEWDKILEQDLKQVFTFITQKKIPEPIVVTSGYADGITIVLGERRREINIIKEKLEAFKKCPSIALDIETSCLRPYMDGARLLTIAIGSFDDIIAFPVEHPHAWNENFDEIKELVKDFLLHSKNKICHHTKFEQEWFAHLFGPEVLFESKWDDTMAQAYIIDERAQKEGYGSKKAHSLLSLDKLILLRFGFNLKALSPVDRKNIMASPLKTILTYNGLDTKWTSRLFVAQKDLIEKKQQWVYNHLMDLSRTLVMTQREGICVDLDELTKFSKNLGEELQIIDEAINEISEVKIFNKTIHSKFNPASPQDVEIMFKKIYKVQDYKSTDDGSLKIYANQGCALAPLIQDRRETAKLKSTYIDSIPKLITPDNLLHGVFNHLFTRTGRLSSEDPNLQNFPKRKHKEIRNIITAPPDHWLVAVDYGQIEARVLAMASLDKTFCGYLWEDYDVHMAWAKKIAEYYPEVVGILQAKDITPEILNKYRSIVKNKWVFPLFYGSSKKSVGRALNLPDDVVEKFYNEFWKTFKGIKKWQETLVKFYDEHGYTETLTGRRRHAPMSYNEMINSPIQGTASDIVTSSMNILSYMAYKTKQRQFQPRLNVHDDLTFYLPNKTLEKDIETIANIMCKPQFKFINVPITIEIEVGIKWGELTKIGVFDSRYL